MNINSNVIYNRGRSNLQAASTDLMTTKGLNQATDVIITGCSAGGMCSIYIFSLLLCTFIYLYLIGLSTYIHVDYWRSVVQASAKVVGIGDAGWFLNANSIYGMSAIIFITTGKLFIDSREKHLYTSHARRVWIVECYCWT